MPQRAGHGIVHGLWSLRVDDVPAVGVRAHESLDDLILASGTNQISGLAGIRGFRNTAGLLVCCWPKIGL